MQGDVNVVWSCYLGFNNLLPALKGILMLKLLLRISN